MSDIYLSVVIPAYNEETRLPASLKAITDCLLKQDYTSEVIVVNDGSTDRTDQVAEGFSGTYKGIRVMSCAKNHGKGYAVRQGVLAARGGFVLFCDADLNTPLEEIEKLLTAMDSGADVAIGSRAANGKTEVAKRPMIREIGSRSLNMAIRLFTVPGVRDTQCGFKLFKASTARNIFSHAFLDGFSFDVEILYIARKLGYSIAEVPVKWFYRGGSKVHPVLDGLRFLKDIVKIRLHKYHLTAAAEIAG